MDNGNKSKVDGKEQLITKVILLIKQYGTKIFNMESIVVTQFRSFDSFEQSLIIKLLGTPTLSISSIIIENPKTTKKINKSLDRLQNDLSIIETCGDKKFKIDQNFNQTLKNFFMFGQEHFFIVVKNDFEFNERIKNEFCFEKWSNLYKHIFKSREDEIEEDEQEDITENVQRTLSNNEIFF